MNHEEEGLNILAPEPRRRALERALTRRQALGAGLTGAAALYLAACGGTSGTSGGGGGGASTKAAAKEASALAGKPIEGQLLMSNWVDYVDPKDLKSFRKELGPKVTLEGYGSNDELIAKLSAGGSNYDVIVPSGSYVPECIQKGLLMPLDHALIPNLKNLEPTFTKTKYDPGNKYSVCKDYGITSFYYRKDVVKDPPTTLKGWFEALPKYKGKNINFIEGGSEIWGVLMLAAGHSESSDKESDYQDAYAIAKSVKPAIKTINSTYIERLGRGQIDIGLGWNGDVLRAALEAKKHGIEIGYTVPQGAGEYWTDNWTISAGAKNPVAAHKWIDYVLRPDIAAKEWNYVGYTVPVIGAKDNVDPAISKSPMIDIPSSTLDGYDTAIVTPQINDLIAKYYTKFKA
jgi:spermidine/putrescine-binding protein